ncbi:efflux RND transporter periplasmic adaptor subunit [Neorhodopirellula pilleata]|uniref:Putative efflux pump membrane fusion protein n=1 Tax=Neorhodopirellula pilleata TaxID=2714738 RepID=A0A5C6ACJ8_9BACT|nr:HlyD family efflux transporter periplasmic adaptor subunit [Neorhodopirellula pilleata]TWT97117.1 putative efflux pump membrane fusion protein [Neorhodopirellula pilleata]
MAEVLSAKASLLIANGGLELAELQLSYTDLRATVAGVVTTRQAEAGQVVVAGAPVYTIAVDGERDVVLDAFPPGPPEKNNIDLSLQSAPPIKAVGFIREMSPKIDPTNGTVRVKVGVKNHNGVSPRRRFISRSKRVDYW